MTHKTIILKEAVKRCLTFTWGFVAYFLLVLGHAQGIQERLDPVVNIPSIASASWYIVSQKQNI